MNTIKISNWGLPTRPKSLKLSSEIAVIAFGLMLACEEVEHKQPQIIQFTSNELFLTEGASTTISLPLSAPAPNNGTVEISFGSSAIYGQHYTTLPATTANSLTLTILAGQRFAQFQIFTANNNEINADRTVVFSLLRPSAGFRLGSQSTLVVTIRDDEQFDPELTPLGPQIFAGIDLQRVRIAETESAGMVVRVTLSQLIEGDFDPFFVPVTATGNVTVKFASGHASYGNDYNTVPAATGDSLVINFTGTQTDTTFTFIPIDNSDLKGSRFISVRISGTTGVIQALSSPSWIEIEDDEAGLNQIKWTRLENTPLPWLASAKFHDENNGYIWGGSNLYKTTDGGLHWIELKPDPAKTYHQIIPFFIDNQNGFVSAVESDCFFDEVSCFSKTTIFKTTDGGTIWSPVKELDLFASSFYFLSETTGFIGTSTGEILKTVDGGKNWQVAVSPIYPLPVSDFTFLGDGTGYAKSHNVVLKTMDSGDSWIASFSAPGETLIRSSSNSLYAIWPDCPNLPEELRAIYKSQDGSNWTLANGCARAETLSLSPSGKLGISIGRVFVTEWQSIVHLTQDSGSSWIPQVMAYESIPLSTVVVASDNACYAFGDNGVILKGEIE